MKKKPLTLLSASLAIFIVAACGKVDSDTFETKPVDGTPVLFDEGMEFYNTEPSIFVDGGEKYIFYTVNSEP